MSLPGGFPDLISTIVGVICKDGLILGSEKLLTSALMLAKTDRRIYHIAKHAGAVVGGRIPDARYIIQRAVNEAENYEDGYDVPISGKTLSGRVSLSVHYHTLFHNLRPLGISTILGAHDSTGFNLFMIKPSGHCFVRTPS